MKKNILWKEKKSQFRVFLFWVSFYWNFRGKFFTLRFFRYFELICLNMQLFEIFNFFQENSDSLTAYGILGENQERSSTCNIKYKYVSIKRTLLLFTLVVVSNTLYSLNFSNIILNLMQMEFEYMAFNGIRLVRYLCCPYK